MVKSMISKQRVILIFTAMLFACLTLSSCEKNKDADSDDSMFCALVNNGEFEATGPLIDKYLMKLEQNRPDQNLEALRSWLEAKSCVDEATILCNSCIYTLPPQSELSIDFISQGEKITLTLDIMMGDSLKFRTYHE
ncbi:MAG: hypothetical protein IPH20_22000 [Bacteroidales bacterium]|nr:hypothetical protein [Bacteroidales bacterium]